VITPEISENSIGALRVRFVQLGNLLSCWS
jgi:hypothetical protein